MVCGGLSAFALRILTGVDRPVCLEQFDTLRLLVRSGSPLFSLKKDTAHLVGLLNSPFLLPHSLLPSELLSALSGMFEDEDLGLGNLLKI